MSPRRGIVPLCGQPVLADGVNGLRQFVVALVNAVAAGLKIRKRGARKVVAQPDGQVEAPGRWPARSTGLCWWR